MRDINDVLEDIKKIIDNLDNFKKIEKIQYSLGFVAPECKWNYVYDKLIEDFIPPKTEIDYKVLSIWTTKSVEELKQAEKNV